jgi:hypothetical protein
LTIDPDKLVEQHVVSGLEKAVGIENINTSKLDDQKFNPEKLAEKILAHVSKAYGEQKSNNPDFAGDQFFSQVKQGIEEGFKSASEELEKLGLLNESSKQSLDAALAKVQEGLAKLEEHEQANSAPLAELQSVSAHISQSAELEIVTKEGDVIKIQLSKSASSSQSSIGFEQDGLSVSAEESSLEVSSSLSVEISGDLNEDEQKVLKKFLKQIDKVQKDFFEGDVEDALRHAKRIGLESDQIASFSLDLSLEKSVQAVSAYQQAALPEQQVEPDKIKQAAEFFNHARELLKSAQSALEPFEEPLTVFQALFVRISQVNESSDNSAATKPSDAANATLQSLAKPLGESVLNA